MGTAASDLVVTLPSDLEIVLTREFDAPRELIFQVVTDPKHIPQWWGRRKDTTTVDKMDVRPGGEWRFVTRADDGEFAFRGTFREIVPPQRLVQTFEFEGELGAVSVETMILEEIGGGRTRMTSTSRFENKEQRDGMVRSGMETGARDTYDRLAELLATMRKA